MHGSPGTPAAAAPGCVLASLARSRSRDGQCRAGLLLCGRGGGPLAPGHPPRPHAPCPALRLPCCACRASAALPIRTLSHTRSPINPTQLTPVCSRSALLTRPALIGSLLAPQLVPPPQHRHSTAFTLFRSGRSTPSWQAPLIDPFCTAVSLYIIPLPLSSRLLMPRCPYLAARLGAPPPVPFAGTASALPHPLCYVLRVQTPAQPPKPRWCPSPLSFAAQP